MRQRVRPAEAFHDETETLRIEAMTLDEMIGDQPVHLVKIDAEGAEPNVLRGLRRTIERNPELCVTIEFAASWYPHGGARRFLGEIEERGFKIRKIGHDSQLLVLTHDELERIAHNDLMLVPSDFEV